MAHAIHSSKGKASMAYVGATPWHGLGQELTPGASIETWVKEAGMDYALNSAQLSYHDGTSMREVADKQLLYRSDTGDSLGLVSTSYKVVQPVEVVEFFRDLSESHGFELETAGVLFGGAKYWALARTPQGFKMGKDEVRAHLMLATACDGSMSTIAKYVATRVVCNNTLGISLRENGGGTIKVRHNSVFNSAAVKDELGVFGESWKETQEYIKALSKRTLKMQEAVDLLIRVMGDPSKPVAEQPNVQNMAAILGKFEGRTSIGGDMASATDTAWGLVNCATEWVDHDRGRSQDRRLEYAWFGGGMELKTRIFEAAKELVC